MDAQVKQLDLFLNVSGLLSPYVFLLRKISRKELHRNKNLTCFTALPEQGTIGLKVNLIRIIQKPRLNDIIFDKLLKIIQSLDVNKAHR